MIDKVRNHISDKKEIIIAPLQKNKEPYLQRIRKAENVHFKPFNPTTRSMSIKVNKVFGEAEFEVFSSIEPKQVKGVENWTYEENLLVASIDKPGTILIKY